MPIYQEIYVAKNKKPVSVLVEIPDGLGVQDMGEVSTIAEYAIIKGENEGIWERRDYIGCGGLMTYENAVDRGLITPVKAAKA